MPDLGSIFEPKSVAIVGASSNPLTPTNINFLTPLLEFGYTGRIYPVNPTAREVMGLKAYPSIRDIPEPVDYVVCAIPAQATPDLIRECVAAKAKAVCMFTAGFSETGDDKRGLEVELVEIARRGGVRILGPNCLGVHCPKAGLTLDGSIPRKSGHVGFLSQSGGNAQHIIMALAGRKIYMSKLISFGNAADIDESDLLEYLAEDSDTRIIGAYIEGIKRPDRFPDVLRQAAKAKPVIILKGGCTPSGTSAIKMHTGALAGSKLVWDAACRQAGVLQACDMQEMIDTIQAFTYLKPPRGRRAGIIGVGGGANVLAADDCEKVGLVLPELPEAVKEELSRFTPLVGTGLRNPVDTATTIYMNPAELAKTAEVIARWDGLDMVFVRFPTLLGIRLGIKCLQDDIKAVMAAVKGTGKPLAIILSTCNFAEGERVGWQVQEQCLDAGVPVYWSFTQAATAVNNLISYHENRQVETPTAG